MSEEQILKFWEENKIFQKTLEKEAPNGEFVFYEGPPTANGKPGIHHVEGRAFKDLIPRYKTMKGFRVQRKAGWDTHGLPVEIEVEKTLNLKGKKDVEEYGIEEFNKSCKESVWKYKEDWEKMTKRIGFWIDMEKPYITYENDYIESLWWIIKEAHKKDLLYKGYKVVPNCPRCGTALSSHEVAQGYKNVEEDSVYIKFKLKNKDNEYILAWTTTPWTLPGNIALAVGGDIDYVKVIQNEKKLILAKNLLNKLEGEYEIIEEMKGKDLIGLEYEPLFGPPAGGVISDDVENSENAFKVYSADFVSTEDGTGVVHTAVMYGVDDYELGEQIGLPKVHTVNLDGTFNNLVPKWEGKFVKDVEKEIIEDLKERNILYKVEKYKHDYPFCWRCGTPLIYYAKDSWYFRMSSLREDLMNNNSRVNWIPSHIKEGRFGEWLKEVKDWAISRERYWGTPLPVWECQSDAEERGLDADKRGETCEHKVVIGSIEELEKLSGKKLDDLHKPYIDEIEFDCDKCGGKMKRVPDVMDCWFDSGAMPFAQIHYPFQNKNLIDEGKMFPADFICEGIDQTRGWFYTLLAVSTILGKEAPYKNVVSYGHILDKKGKKMSKSVGNVVDPNEMMDKYGPDTLRWYIYTVNSPGDPILFDEESLKKSKRVFTTLSNVLSFYKMFGEEDVEKPHNSKNILDQWMLAKLNKLIKEVSENLDNYNMTTSSRDINDFIIVDLSQWYVRRSRDRFKNGDKEGIKTLGFVLYELTKLIAPFAPFTAESIYKELKSSSVKDSLRYQDFGGQADETMKESVHLESYPSYAPADAVAPEGKLDLVADLIIENMNSVRELVTLGLNKRMENEVKVRQPLQSLKFHKKSLDGKDEYLNLIKEEVNVKEVILDSSLEENIVELDLELTPELVEEGNLRDLLRSIQDLRKKKKLLQTDFVKLSVKTDDKGKEFISKFEEEIKKTTLLSEIVFENIEGEKLQIGETNFILKI